MENTWPTGCHLHSQPVRSTRDWSPSSSPLKPDVASEFFTLHYHGQSLPAHHCWHANQKLSVTFASRCDCYLPRTVNRQKSSTRLLPPSLHGSEGRRWYSGRKHQHVTHLRLLVVAACSGLRQEATEPTRPRPQAGGSHPQEEVQEQS